MLVKNFDEMIPLEIFTHILLRLQTKILPKCRLVCRNWYHILRQKYFWKHKIERDFYPLRYDPTIEFQGNCQTQYNYYQQLHSYYVSIEHAGVRRIKRCLLWSIGWGHLPLLKVLVQHPTVLTNLPRWIGWSISSASQWGHLAIIKFLLDLEISIRPYFLRHALDLAGSSRHIEVSTQEEIKALLNNNLLRQRIEVSQV
jgi:hypothetical protein